MAVQLFHLFRGFALLASGTLIMSCLHALLSHCDAISIRTRETINSTQVVILATNAANLQEETVPPEQEHDQMMLNERAARELCIYTITIVTGKKLGAGTDSTISLRFYNNASETVYFPSLDNAKNNFERGDVDNFQETGDCVDHICKMILYTDNGGILPGWYVDSVGLSVTSNAAGNQVKTWQLHEWLPRDSSAAFFDIRDNCS